MNQLIIVARLREGKHAEAEKLLRNGPPFKPEELGFDRHAVYLTATEVVFLFEAPSVEWIVNDVIDDPIVAAAFAPWRAIVDGPPRLAHRRYYWSHELEESGVGLGF